MPPHNNTIVWQPIKHATHKDYRGRARFSEDGRHRHWLRRRWGWALDRCVAFIGLNPSQAGGDRDDATIRRCVRFASDWGYDQLIMVNLYDYISTDPKGLFAHTAAVTISPRCDTVLQIAVDTSHLVVCCWGHPKAALRAYQVLTLPALDKKDLFCFGKTKDGQPLHPLRLSAMTPLVRLEAA